MTERTKEDAIQKQIQAFWDRSPVASKAIPYPLGTREYFEHFARLRERIEPPTFFARWHELDHFQGKRVLDIGSGNGYVLSHYAQHGALVSGVDLSKTAIELCRTRFGLFELQGSFLQGSALDLPYAGETFDCVCSMGVLHHTGNIHRSLQEIWRVLKPGGRLILMLYHRDSALYRFLFPMLSHLRSVPIEQLVNEVDGVGNPKGEVFSKREVEQLLHGYSDLQLEIRTLQGWMLLPKGGRFVPDWLFKPFESRVGWFLYAKASKPN